jgi:hypothetical protein
MRSFVSALGASIEGVVAGSQPRTDRRFIDSSIAIGQQH